VLPGVHETSIRISGVLVKEYSTRTRFMSFIRCKLISLSN